MKMLLLASLMLMAACAAPRAGDVPPGELERMRAQMPAVQNPPVSYNEKGIGVP